MVNPRLINKKDPLLVVRNLCDLDQSYYSKRVPGRRQQIKCLKHKIPSPALGEICGYERDYSPSFQRPEYYIDSKSEFDWKYLVTEKPDLAINYASKCKLTKRKNTSARENLQILLKEIDMANVEAYIRARMSLVLRDKPKHFLPTKRYRDNLSQSLTIKALMELSGLHLSQCKRIMKYWIISRFPTYKQRMSSPKRSCQQNAQFKTKNKVELKVISRKMEMNKRGYLNRNFQSKLDIFDVPLPPDPIMPFDAPMDVCDFGCFSSSSLLSKDNISVLHVCFEKKGMLIAKVQNTYVMRPKK